MKVTPGYNSEEAERFMREKEEQAEQAASFRILRQKIEAGEVAIAPLWNVNPTQEDFDAQGGGFNWYRAKDAFSGGQPDFIRLGHVVITASIEKILTSLGKKFGKKYRKFEYLFQESQCHKILQHWQQGNSLVPPHFMNLHSSIYDVVDGRHRLNLAYLLKQEEIPLNIPRVQEEVIRNLLQA